MTTERSHFEASTTEIRLSKWIEYATFFVKSLGLTVTEEVNDVNAIGCTVTDNMQFLNFTVITEYHKTDILLSYVLKKDSDVIILSYTKTSVEK